MTSKNIRPILLILIFTVTSALNAKNYSDGGLSGSLGLSYYDDVYTNNNHKNTNQNFMQEYRLRYLGNIYSPKLLDYSLEGLLRYENIDSDIDSTKSQTKNESQDYKAMFNFLKESKIPFSVYTQKSESPISTMYSSSLVESTHDVEKRGIQGAVLLDIFNIDYSASNEKSINSGLLYTQDREVDSYRASIRRDEKAYSVQLAYNHTEQDIEELFVDTYSEKTDQEDDTVNLLYRWIINDELTLNTNANYSESDYLLTTTTLANLNLSWAPKKEYYGSLYVSASSSDYYSDINELNVQTKELLDTMDTVSISQLFGYRITENLNLTQSLGYNGYTNNNGEGDNINANLGTSYSFSIDENTSATMSISGGVNLNTTKLVNDLNSSSSSKQNYLINTSAGVTKILASINSKLNTNASIYQSKNSIDESNGRYSLGSSLSSRILSEYFNSFNVNYLIENAKYRSYTVGNEGMSSRAIRRLDVSDNVNFSNRLGVMGSVFTNVGVVYSNIKNDELTLIRVVPKADVTLNYRLGPRLMYKAAAHVHSDITYDVLTYSANTELSYVTGKTSVLLAYRYNKIENGAGNYQIESDLHHYDIKVTRKF